MLINRENLKLNSIEGNRVELEVDYKGIDRLERNIEDKNEYSVAYVYFDNNLNAEKIMFAIQSMKIAMCDEIIVTLEENEKEEIINFAKQELIKE
ncbi:hypothetical protein [Clostridium sp.]|uniref:hypothetical protein n=1 Tax=Clostridium sp. TaxID=1506 RepID=UPI00291237FC|nr:hypothetical protein [Clostridium sp.]MDU3410050.1 hypothetical protein [Clostridium sp.]